LGKRRGGRGKGWDPETGSDPVTSGGGVRWKWVRPILGGEAKGKRKKEKKKKVANLLHPTKKGRSPPGVQWGNKKKKGKNGDRFQGNLKLAKPRETKQQFTAPLPKPGKARQKNCREVNRA